MRKFRSALRLPLALLIVASIASPANADRGGWGFSPDNLNQYYQDAYLTDRGFMAYNYGRTELAPTAIQVYSGSGDVTVRDWNSAENADAWGWTQCDAYFSNGSCDKMLTVFNQRHLDGASDNIWRSTACHEFGHGANLGHRDMNQWGEAYSPDADQNSCMRNDNIFPLHYDSHDVNDIAADWDNR